MQPTGSGPGAQTKDGCSVELYRRMPAMAEPEIIAAAVPAGSTILELGSGAGRLTHALIALGYRVTAVDNSAEMLSHVRGAQTVLSDIETLDLRATFDAVLMASCLINLPTADTRKALLSACWRHIGAAGAVLIERRDPTTFGTMKVGLHGEIGDVRCFVESVHYDGRLAHGTLRYEASDDVWTHSFVHELMEDRQIESELRQAGLRLVRWLNSQKTWILAKRAT